MLKGHLLNDRYQIGETIGGGGMANVYLANDTILNRDVAVKVLRLDYANDEEFIARFDREAQSATSLSHPNVVNIYDVGEEDHILYMVMEYVDGMTLKEYIQSYGPIDVQEALDIMKQVTAAISHAHANDIVHRDIKPQNILIDSYGRVKVTDFGIAVALSATSLTQTNSILGSVHYLSPEQARGGMATKKSDVYSLGIVLFELLTGRLPFSGQSPVSIALKHLQNDTPSVKRFNPDVPQSVENIVLKATAKDPFHRYDTVYDLEDGLETALDPDRIDEEKYVPPSEAGEETKAIPIITDNQLQDNVHDNTLVHQANESTKNFTNNNDNQSDSKTGNRKRKKKWLIFFIILFALFGIGIAAYFIISAFQPKDVVIPDVTNMEYEEALTELRDLNLETERELMYSEDVEEDIVIKTNPQTGSTVKEESLVTIFVSQGKEKVAFGDYVGEDYNQVKSLLESKGYTDFRQFEIFDDNKPGVIIGQIEPSPGTEVVPSETKVIFEVSKGQRPIYLDNLEGMTEQEAITALEDQGLSANIEEEYSETVSEGEVIRQDPTTGTEMEKGDTVKLYISKGAEEKPPKNHSETFTVVYNPDSQESENQDEPVKQSVKIYIGDANRKISDVAIDETITEDKEYNITLTINPDSIAQYKVVRDGNVYIDKSIRYEDVEGE
ncbi:serine/threonine protein kinase [Virgibacillus subterraneus]|uniref:Serine/threonine-protein kinase PrkC n=2 Tax=Virgibacillus TaxID=84406 RepID=A0A1H1CCF7_9BACI|nr:MULTISPECIES: Stk1 family PASTA domain-containing Ser/Thr kinase [Virgibacillus]SDQ61885.1 serine/threonine protein kinase [Virgibacillus salinus]SEQ59875.1 serine/threonine protein kinase [Virgibacillus subterraneus]